MNHLNNTVIRHRLSLLGLLMLITLLAACASAPLAPADSLNAARNAIASAEQAGARQHAAPELEEAQARMVMAEEAVEDENMATADRFAQQSRIAAELAMAKTETSMAEEFNRGLGGTDMQQQGDQ